MRFNHFASACAILAFCSLLASPATAQVYCPDGECNFGETQCDCPADCGAPPANEILGSTCDDGIDNDCDGLADGKDSDCVLPVCGDNVVNQASEECDGTDDAACPEQCQADCTCPPPAICGDNVVNQASEQCDGTDDAACPEQCSAVCQCESGGGGGIPTVSQWGIATLALLLLVGARVYFTRRRTASA